MQEMMARTGSFPLHVPYGLVRRFGRPGGVVLDPFCGKGTSILAARLLGRPAYGLDVAPEAVICSRAKLLATDVRAVESYIRRLPTDDGDCADVPDEVRIFFHPATLSQILSVRDALLHDVDLGRRATRSCATVALGLLLGILHGHASYSLSLPSSHAYSMSPQYVQRYSQEHGLTAPLRSVQECLLAKAARCFRDPLPPSVAGDVMEAPAAAVATAFPELTGRVDLVVTSPPYLAAQTYAKDNRLRLWLLNRSYPTIRAQYIQTQSIDRYRDLLTEAFAAIAKALRRSGKLVCIAGDVRHTTTSKGERRTDVIRTGDLLADICRSRQVGLRITHRSVHRVVGGRRYLNALANSNGHSQRDMVERVFVAER